MEMLGKEYLARVVRSVVGHLPLATIFSQWCLEFFLSFFWLQQLPPLDYLEQQ
jgi:hypothetical protein